MAKQSIGEFLATLRKANGYTQQEIADRLGISNRTLSGWECDKVLPDILLLPTLAEIYGVTVDEILAGERSNTRGSNVEKILHSPNAEKQFLQSKLNNFTTRTHILLATIIVGIMLVFVGWYLDITNVGQNSWQWWLLILISGLMTVAISTVLLFALWRNASLSNYQSDELSDEHYSVYCLLVCKRFVTALYIVAAVSFLMPIFQLIGHAISPSKILGFWFYMLLPFSIVYAVTIFVIGLRLFNSTMRKYRTSVGGGAEKGLIKKVSLFGLIPVGLALVLAITLACCRPSERKVIYACDNLEAFVIHMETFVDGENEYSLPLSTLYRYPDLYEEFLVDGNSSIFTEGNLYRFGQDNNAFFCNINYWAATVRNECVNADGKKTVVNRIAHKLFENDLGPGERNPAEDLAVYNLRYANIENEFLEQDFVKHAKCGVVDDRGYGGYYYGEFFVDVEYDYTVLGLECAAIILCFDIVVCAAICIYKQQKCSVKL